MDLYSIDTMFTSLPVYSQQQERLRLYRRPKEEHHQKLTIVSLKTVI